MLVLAFGVRLYCAGALAQYDRMYRTIAQAEYMGAEYPNSDEPDPFARDALAQIDPDAVTGIDGVLSWTPSARSLFHVEGYRRYSGQIPYQNRAVIVISHISSPVYATNWVEDPNAEDDPDGVWWGDTLIPVPTDEISYYTAIMGPVLYSYEGKSDLAVAVLPGEADALGGETFAPEAGKAYVLHGVFLEEGVETPLHGTRNFMPLPFPDSDEKPWAEYTGGDSVGEIFRRYAEEYRLMNSYVDVTFCADPENLYEFHQGQLYLTSGRMPETAEECLISADMARSLSLAPGDSLQATAFAAGESDRYALTLTDRTEELQVVGVVNQADGFTGHMWRLGEGTGEPLFGYLLGTAALENGKAADAAQALEALMPENVRLSVLDQGYADAAEPFRAIESTAQRVLAVCLAGMAAVLLLFAYLYVGRQNGTVKIMVSLGTPRARITQWLLSGSLVIAGGAAVAGGALGAALLPLLFRAVQLQAQAQSGGKLRYSETVLGMTKEVELQVAVPLWPILALIGGVLLAALGLCLLFLRGAYRGGTLRRGKTRVHVPRGKTSAALSGSMRFAWLSIRRGGWRSVVVPVVSAALTVTLLFLGSIYQGWQQDLDDALRHTALEGQVTSTSGRLFSGLVIPLDTVRQLYALEDVDDMYLSQRWPYYLSGEMPAFSATSFGEEHREAWIARQPDVVAVNALKGAKEFYFTDPVVTWLDGWDESCLARSYPEGTGVGSFEFSEEYNAHIYRAGEPWPAVVSDQFLASHGLAPGDTLAVICNYETLPLQVVGVYKQSGNRAHIYVPLAKYIDPEYVFGGELPEVPEGAMWFWGSGDYESYRLRSSTFSTCRFTLRSAAHLDQTRQRLFDAGYSWPEHLRTVRTTLLLRDASFIKLTDSLGRYLAMGRVMMGLIFAVVALLGLIISWLMVNGRKREFALMRGFGAPGGRVFRSFFWEQALLCLLGCILGCAAIPWLGHGTVQLLAVGGYLLFYLAGCIAAVRIAGKTDLMALLSTRE